MKKIFLSFLSVMLFLCMGIAIQTIGEQTKSSVNATEQVSQAFEMEEGASFRSYWTLPNCGITFGAKMGENNENLSKVRLFLAPYDFVVDVRGESTEDIDYINAFDKAGKRYMTIIPAIIKEGGVASFRAGIKSIQNGNLNRPFFGIYYYQNGVDENNKPIYVYAEMIKGEEEQARSMAYVSSYFSTKATSANDIEKTSYYVDKSINNAVDRANKVKEEIVVDINELNVTIEPIKYLDDLYDYTLTYKEVDITNYADLYIKWDTASIPNISIIDKKIIKSDIVNGTANVQIAKKVQSVNVSINPIPYEEAEIAMTDELYTEDVLNNSQALNFKFSANGNRLSNKTLTINASSIVDNLNGTANLFVLDNRIIGEQVKTDYITYKIEYNANGGVNKNDIYSYTVLDNDINLLDADKKGYKFTSWLNDGQEISVIEVSSFKDYFIAAEFDVNKYNVLYDYNNGSGSGNNGQVAYDEKFTVVSPTRAGYKFSGWQVEGVDTSVARYGSDAIQDNEILSDLSYCYQKNSNDKDYSNREYWNGDVTFKNLTAEDNDTITLKATWTCLTKLRDTDDACGVINNAGQYYSEQDRETSSKLIEVLNGATGDFVLTFTYYQNAIINQDDNSYNNVSSKTGALGIGKFCDWDYFNWIRQDGFMSLPSSRQSITNCSTDGTYNDGNSYEDMFYGLSGNTGNVTSTKFGEFVKNSLVTYTIKGYKVGQVNGYLQVTQTIKSLTEKYKNQEYTIVYDLDLKEGLTYFAQDANKTNYFYAGLDFCISANDTEISVVDVNYEILSDGYSYVSASESIDYVPVMESYNHFCPDYYWKGDFDFLITFNSSMAGGYGIEGNNWASFNYRNSRLVFYEWGNVTEHINIRPDWYASKGENTTKIEYVNEGTVDNFDTISTGRCSSYETDIYQMWNLTKNATITCRCVREGNVVTVTYLISKAGSQYVEVANVYKFTTTIEELSFQILGRTSGFTVTNNDFASNNKILTGNSLEVGTYGFYNYYSAAKLKTRGHIAFPIKIPAGSKVKFSANNTYDIGVVEMGDSYRGEYEDKSSDWKFLKDSGWLTTTDLYVVEKECYIAINIRYDNNTTSFPNEATILQLFRDYLQIEINYSNNLHQSSKYFSSEQLKEHSTYGLTTYSGQFGESDTRCHIALIPLFKKGTTVSFTGGSNYMFSVNELASERIVLKDTGWQNHDVVYTVSQDCYLAINVRHIDNYNYTFNAEEIYSLLYDNIKISGQYSTVYNDNAETHSKTEVGDMQSVNHRGYSSTAPENTISAYSMSKQVGFTKVECDISFTSDGYAVLLHDSSIDRTSTGSGNITELNFSAIRGYDFGSWKNTVYTGEIIPTVEEFLLQCKNLSLHPYLEIKNDGSVSKAEVLRLVTLVRRLGMEDNVTWISFDLKCLTYVRDASPEARLGYLSDSTDYVAVVNNANSLKTGRNEVFLDLYFGLIDTTAEANNWVNLARENSLPIEAWTVNDEATMKTVYNATGGYVTGFTSDNTIAENVQFT